MPFDEDGEVMGKTHLHQGRRRAGQPEVNKSNLSIAAILANFGGSCRRGSVWLVAIGLKNGIDFASIHGNHERIESLDKGTHAACHAKSFFHRTENL